MSILEKGMNQTDVQAVFGKMYGSRQALSSLKFGILLVMVGLGVLVGGIIDHLYNVNDGFMPGIILLFGGVGLLIFYFIARKSTPKE
jgi:divalent metal cation (Fe/Co/Zn/Cd) transporter